MTEKRQTSQGYIIRILQHFATKLRNITNFVMIQTCLDQNFTQKGKGLFEYVDLVYFQPTFHYDRDWAGDGDATFQFECIINDMFTNSEGMR